MTDTGLHPRSADDIRFVRSDMIAATEPPQRETGAVHWLRANLLSGPLNIILTILSLWLLWSVLKDFLPWALRGIWNADSLTECRAIRDATFAAGTEVACWAVITERWNQLIFGYFPPGGYWRPLAALALFLVSVAPVLFTTLPRRMLWLTALMPFVVFALLWGGPIWTPLSVAVGFALGWLAYRAVSRSGNLAMASAAAVLVPLLYWFVIAGPIDAALSRMLPWGLAPVGTDKFGGFTLSVVIGLSAICLSLPLGILLALGRRSDMVIISAVCTAYIEIIRGVPLIVWLFTAQLLLNYFLPRGVNFDLMLRVIIMTTLFSAAYIAEVIRGGLAALSKGQQEGADSLGLDYWQSTRLIVLPQALKISIPGIVNSFIGLFKDTTLVVFIGMFDPMGVVKTIRASTDWNGIYWELYVFVAAIFFAFCFSMSRYSIWLERRLERDHR